MMAAELLERPSDAVLRSSLVERELELSRFRSALDHAQALGSAGASARGRALYFLTRYEEALEWLVASDPELVLMRVECFRALGRMNEADALLPQVAKHFGEQDARYRLLVGRKLLREGEAAAASIEFRAVLAARPLEAEALFGLGRALLKDGEREAGLAVLARHRELAPRLDALDFARRGVALSPNNAANQAALGDAWKDLMGFDAGASERARAAYARALTLASGADLVPISLRAARLLAESGEQYSAACELLEATIAKHDDVRLRVRAADYLMGTGELARARVHLEEALKQRPADRAILQRLAKLEAEEAR